MANVTNISWLSCYKPNPAATLRLFCFPYAGSSALIYRDWTRSFPGWVEVCPVQLPGRGVRLREKPFVRMDQLVKALLRDMRPYLSKPFAFFGHSMGAVIGYEITRLLRRENAMLPVHLFVSGRGAPQKMTPKPPTYNLPDAAFKQELRRLKGTPAEVLAHPELMEVVMPLLRADFELIQTYNYKYEQPLNIPLTALGGLEDEISHEEFEGWRAETTGPFSLHMFPGDHFYLTTNQQLLPPILTEELSTSGLGSNGASANGAKYDSHSESANGAKYDSHSESANGVEYDSHSESANRVEYDSHSESANGAKYDSQGQARAKRSASPLGT